MNSGDTSRKSIFNLPKNTSAQIDIMLHKSHPTIFRPAFAIIVANNIFIIGIWILSQISLNQFSGFITGELEQDV